MANEDPAHMCDALKTRVSTLLLSTVGEGASGMEPHGGYTPFIVDDISLVVFVSQLAAHTRDMLANQQAAVLIIDDEQSSSNLFARSRVSYQCSASVIPATDVQYEQLLDMYHDRHGKMVSLLRQLPDFVLMKLTPRSGQFVMGFGKAFRIQGERLETFVHTRTG